MSVSTSTVENRLKEQLQGEIWSSSNIEKIVVKDFTVFQSLLGEVNSEQERNDIYEFCETFLARNSKNVAARYIVAVIDLQRQSIDDSNIEALVDMFVKATKWNIVEFLCNHFLEYAENRYLLRTLAECYDRLGRLKDKISTWERFIHIDFNEDTIVQQLAELKQKEGDTVGAINYYKKALHRSINKQDFDKIHSLWLTLSDLVLEEFSFFLQIESKVAKHIETNQLVLLLEELYTKYKDSSRWDIAVELLKRILAYNSENSWARKELIDCYKMLYKTHSNLEEYIKESNLDQSWRNVQEAIADFEKHISFDANNFVFHRNWGVGIIRSIHDNSIVVDFPRNKNHTMSLKMALSALEILPKDHIWVLRSVVKPEKLKKMVKENIRNTLKILIKSFSNSIDMKTVRAELVPYVLTEKEWVSWNTKARKILKTDNMFGTVRDMPDHYEIRTEPISLVEKMYNGFIAEKQFFMRVRLVIDFLKIGSSTVSASDTELLRDMLDYFYSFLKKTEVDAYTATSLLIIRKAIHLYPFLSTQVELTLSHYIKSPSEAYSIYRQIENKELQLEYTQIARHEIDNWHILYLELLHKKPSKIVLAELYASSYKSKLQEALNDIIANYHIYQHAYMWVVLNQNQDQFSWLADYLPKDNKVCVAVAHLFEIVSYEIASRREVIENKRLLRSITQFLFKEHNLLRLAKEGTEERIAQIIPILPVLQASEASAIVEIKSIIATRFPQLTLETTAESAAERADNSFQTVRTSYFKKQRELQHIHDVAVPENSMEIQRAREMGDLKENAEYKSAKEQQQILNSTAAKLESELSRAVVVEKERIDTTKVGFGTHVFLKDASNKPHQYTLLGPWESDPDNAIISYLSPLGQQLTNHRVGDTVQFQLQDQHYEFVIEKIERAPQLK